MENASMYVWKFIIRTNDWRKQPDNPSLEWSGCVAAAISKDQETAKKHLQRYAAENGLDSRWLDVADVIRLPIMDGTTIAWAEK